jgi:hypothetical protein
VKGIVRSKLTNLRCVEGISNESLTALLPFSQFVKHFEVLFQYSLSTCSHILKKEVEENRAIVPV